MKKNIKAKNLDLFIGKLLERKPSWYDSHKENIEKVFIFILENNLIEPDVSVVTYDYYESDPSKTKILDDELNFSWDFWHEELDGFVYVDSGFFEDGDFAYYVKLGEKFRYEKNKRAKEFSADKVDPSNPFPEEILKYLKKDK